MDPPALIELEQQGLIKAFECNGEFAWHTLRESYLKW